MASAALLDEEEICRQSIWGEILAPMPTMLVDVTARTTEAAAAASSEARRGGGDLGKFSSSSASSIRRRILALKASRRRNWRGAVKNMWTLGPPFIALMVSLYVCTCRSNGF